MQKYTIMKKKKALSDIEEDELNTMVMMKNTQEEWVRYQ